MELCHREDLWNAMTEYAESWPCTDDDVPYLADETLTFRGREYALCAICAEDIREQIRLRKRDGNWSAADAAEFDGLFPEEPPEEDDWALEDLADYTPDAYLS